jgi:hypothetical protein
MNSHDQQKQEEEHQKWQQALRDDKEFDKWLQMLDRQVEMSGLQITPESHERK